MQNRKKVARNHKILNYEGIDLHINLKLIITIVCRCYEILVITLVKLDYQEAFT